MANKTSFIAEDRNLFWDLCLIMWGRFGSDQLDLLMIEQRESKKITNAHIDSFTVRSFTSTQASNLTSSSGTTCFPDGWYTNDLYGSSTAWYFGACTTPDHAATWTDVATGIVPMRVDSVPGAQISIYGKFQTSGQYDTWREHPIRGVASVFVAQASGDYFFYIVSGNALVKMPIYTSINDY